QETVPAWGPRAPRTSGAASRLGRYTPEPAPRPEGASAPRGPSVRAAGATSWQRRAARGGPLALGAGAAAHPWGSALVALAQDLLDDLGELAARVAVVALRRLARPREALAQLLLCPEAELARWARRRVERERGHVL